MNQSRKVLRRVVIDYFRYRGAEQVRFSRIRRGLSRSPFPLERMSVGTKSPSATFARILYHPFPEDHLPDHCSLPFQESHGLPSRNACI